MTKVEEVALMLANSDARDTPKANWYYMIDAALDESKKPG